MEISYNTEQRTSIFKTGFNCESIASRNYMNFVRKFVETNSALGIPKGGVGRKRRVGSEETMKRLEEAVQNTPRKSFFRVSQYLGCSIGITQFSDRI
jgi:hypothetical protein